MAVGAILGTFGARLGLDTSDFVKGTINAETAARIFGQGFVAFVSNPLLGGLDLLRSVTSRFFELGAQVLATSEEIQRLAASTGLATDTLQALRSQAELAGYGAGIVEGSIRKLAEELGKAQVGMVSSAEKFARLGVSLEGIGSTEDALRRVLDALFAYEDASLRAAMATEVFGGQGPQLIDTISGGSEALDEMIQRARDFGQVMREDVVNANANFNTTIGELNRGLQGLQTQLVAEFIAGFAREFDTGAKGAQDLSATLQNELLPAARNLGEYVGKLVGDLEDVADLIERIARSDFVLGIGAYREAFREGTIEGQSSLLSQGIHVVGTPSRLFEDWVMGR